MTHSQDEDGLQSKAMRACERALDVALSAEHADADLLALGLKAAELVLTNRLELTSLDEDATGAEKGSQQLLRVDPISLEVAGDLADLANPEIDGQLLDRLKNVRRRIAVEFGVIAPGVRVRPNPQLTDGNYRILVKGDIVARGHVLLTHLMGTGINLDVPGFGGEHVVEPVYDAPAVWLPTEAREAALEHGLQVFDPQDVVSTHVAEMIKQHLDELLTREEVSELLNIACREAPTVVAELVPNLLSLGQIRQVLQNLVREQVSIKDLATILNTLADCALYSKDPFSLTEHVRAALGRTICQRYLTPGGSLRAFTLSPGVERSIQGAITHGETGPVLNLDPTTSQQLQDSIAQALMEIREQILDPIIVCTPRIRRHVKVLFERNFAKLVVIGYSEIVPGVIVENLATIDVPRASQVDLNDTPSTSSGDLQDITQMTW